MDCPVCRTAMIVLELDEVEVDYCTDCQGIWLDAGELEILLEDTAAAARVMKSLEPAQSAEHRRKCPICRKSMDKVLIGKTTEQNQELIDRCPKGHGLWFDRGELQQVVKMGRFDDDGKVQNLLGGLFLTQ